MELYLCSLFKSLSNKTPEIYSNNPYLSYLYKIVCDSISTMYKSTPIYLCQENNSSILKSINEILKENENYSVELKGFYVNQSNTKIEITNLMNKGIVDFVMSKISVLETVLSVSSQMLRTELIVNKHI